MKTMSPPLSALFILFIALMPLGCLTGDDDETTPPQGSTVLRVNGGSGSPGDGSSWANAFADLGEAIAAAGANSSVNEIWVAAGSYEGAGPRGDRAGAFNMVDNIRLYGGFAGNETERDERDWLANETILDGNGASHVISADLTSGGTVDGFTITGGNATGNARDGGGVYFSIASFDVPPTVRNCRFLDNRADSMGFGGGMYSNVATTVANCVFIGNEAGNGSGLHLSNSFAGDHSIVANCIFIGNGGEFLGSGGGLEIANGAGEVTVVGCVFDGNKAEFGSGFDLSGNGTIANCTFMRNESRLSLGAAGLRCFNSVASIVNCIFYENFNHDGATETAQISGYPSLTVAYCCVDSLENFPADTNFDVDPLFRDPDGPDMLHGTEDDNLHLSGGSQCSGSGNAALLPADFADLDGDGDTTEPTPVDLDGIAIGAANVSRGAYQTSGAKAKDEG